MSTHEQQHQLLKSASLGFDFLFSNNVAEAKTHFAGKDDPFHLLGASVVTFVQAALGMERNVVSEASGLLSLAEAGARKQYKTHKATAPNQRFPPGLEWEILHADAVVLLGLTHALGETYMGYVQCMYSLNNAHSKFTKLYKTVFPLGLNAYNNTLNTPTPPSSRNSSSPGEDLSRVTTDKVPTPTARSFFSRWTEPPSSLIPNGSNDRNSEGLARDMSSDGPTEELIIAGTAFGFGLFNLVFSLLPKKAQSLVGFLGFKHDRQLALQALALAATKKDVHSVFAGLVLMTYHGIILLLSGYQADEANILRQYKAIVDSIEARYPNGALWILNRAKILRMSYDAESAIRVLRDGLTPERPHKFAQADSLLVFELAWTLLGQMEYQEAALMFLKIVELNSWSHATYYFLAAGCHISLGNWETARDLLNVIPGLLDKRKVGGRELPTEVFIKKKLEFYKDKQRRRGGPEADYAQAIKISIAEELGIFWNVHVRIDRRLAIARIKEWGSLTPPLSGPLATAAIASSDHNSQSSHSPSSVANSYTLPDLDTPDELALRILLLGICHRTAGNFDTARMCLVDASAPLGRESPKDRKGGVWVISTWIRGVSMFELAVLELKEVEALERVVRSTTTTGEGGGETVLDVDKGEGVAKVVREWGRVLESAVKMLDKASEIVSGVGGGVDLLSRLESRIGMLREEIRVKRGMLRM